MSEVKGLSIDSLYVKCRINKKEHQLVKRFSRILITWKNNSPQLTYEIIDKDKWSEVSKEEFHAKADERRMELLKQLRADLISWIKETKAEEKKET